MHMSLQVSEILDKYLKKSFINICIYNERLLKYNKRRIIEFNREQITEDKEFGGEMAQSNFGHFMREFGNNVRTLKTLKGAEKAEIINVVEDYHRQREKGEDGISTTTQTMWYANRLSRNALERHGLCMSETYQWQGSRGGICFVNR